MKFFLKFSLIYFLLVFQVFAIPFKPASDNFILGLGANGIDKIITFDEGVNNPYIGWSVSESSIVISNDGIAEQRILAAEGTITVTASTALAIDGEEIVSADASIGDIVLDLPDASSKPGAQFNIIKTSTSNLVTIDASGSQTIDGFLTLVLRAENDSVIFFSDGSNWKTIIKKMAPTSQIFITGSGTYNRPDHVKYIRVRGVGGGGDNISGNGATGGTTTFGSSLLTANGGTCAVGGGISAGGTASVNAPAVGFARQGAAGAGIHFTGTTGDLHQGGIGGSTPFGGGGGGSWSTATAGNGATNSGAGGGGGGGQGASVYSGNGGGSGGYFDARIVNPSTSYSYAIGAGGAGTAGGTNGGDAGDGAEGFIIVDENY